MYSQQDLDEAVAAGAMSAESAAALRAFVERQKALPAVDEEHFRLLTGFNDIFVSIAAVILLFAVAWIGQVIGAEIGVDVDNNGPSPVGPAAVAAAAWGLALFFTAKRRMALPSILLLLAFVGGVFSAVLLVCAMVTGDVPDAQEEAVIGISVAVSGLVAAGAAWLHWKRFRVPITVAAGAGAAAAIVIGLVLSAIGDRGGMDSLVLVVVLLLGLGVFVLAMRWDASDPGRVTRRSDVAFWLHLLAAPMIVHPVFALLGLTGGEGGIGEGLIVILLYVALGLAALAIDRRALLVSALAYVLFAMQGLLRSAGAVELNVALTALVIGSGLLMLSAFWHQARRAVVGRLPGTIRARLPDLQRPAAALSPAPAA